LDKFLQHLGINGSCQTSGQNYTLMHQFLRGRKCEPICTGAFVLFAISFPLRVARQIQPVQQTITSAANSVIAHISKNAEQKMALLRGHQAKICLLIPKRDLHILEKNLVSLLA